ncbi:hypothetical protein XENORESO_011850 [Xenotaenia resolanae]|uniref:Uncharacterized protein n=1 Tax=Xenotaenia resolanae TaxID=208358 RepID=A0ABV0WS61_9TELE
MFHKMKSEKCGLKFNCAPAVLSPRNKSDTSGIQLGRCLKKCFEPLNISQSTAQSVSQSFSTAYSIVGRGEAGAYLQQSMGERQGTPWTGRQSITGHCSIIYQKLQTYVTTVNLPR